MSALLKCEYVTPEASLEAEWAACKREYCPWDFFTFGGLAAAVPLPAFGVELPLGEIYRKVPLA